VVHGGSVIAKTRIILLCTAGAAGLLWERQGDR
jgi:hypothetical protein